MLKEIGYCSGRAGARAALFHAARLFPAKFPRLHRREPYDHPADPRHVSRRPRAQDQPRRLRIPHALCLRQPPAHLRGIRRARAAAHLRFGDARALRARTGRPGRRTAHPPDGAFGSARLGAPHQGADRRPSLGDPHRHEGGRQGARDDAHQAHGGIAHRLFEGKQRQSALYALGHRHVGAHRYRQRAAFGRIRRLVRHQPAARRARSARSAPRRHSGRRQRGVLAERDFPRADHR